MLHPKSMVNHLRLVRIYDLIVSSLAIFAGPINPPEQSTPLSAGWPTRWRRFIVAAGRRGRKSGHLIVKQRVDGPIVIVVTIDGRALSYPFKSLAGNPQGRKGQPRAHRFRRTLMGAVKEPSIQPVPKAAYT
jgi:hypothetical protein